MAQNNNDNINDIINNFNSVLNINHYTFIDAENNFASAKINLEIALKQEMNAKLEVEKAYLNIDHAKSIDEFNILNNFFIEKDEILKNATKHVIESKNEYYNADNIYKQFL